jgi:hypothetical protein
MHPTIGSRYAPTATTARSTNQMAAAGGLHAGVGGDESLLSDVSRPVLADKEIYPRNSNRGVSNAAG